jgi:hypothetical protein
MFNLQLKDTLDGGHFYFDRNDYQTDEGIYTELYVTLFGTSSATWWADGAFGTIAPNVSSKTGITIKNNASINQPNLNIIRKTVNDDLKRFTEKNPNIEVSNVVIAYQKTSLLIIIELTGFNEAFNFIYQNTKETLDSTNWQIY